MAVTHVVRIGKVKESEKTPVPVGLEIIHDTGADLFGRPSSDIEHVQMSFCKIKGLTRSHLCRFVRRTTLFTGFLFS